MVVFSWYRNHLAMGYPDIQDFQATNHWVTDSEPMWSLPTVNVDHFLSFPVGFYSTSMLDCLS